MLRPVNISFDEDDNNHNNAILLHDCFREGGGGGLFELDFCTFFVLHSIFFFIPWELSTGVKK